MHVVSVSAIKMDRAETESGWHHFFPGQVIFTSFITKCVSLVTWKTSTPECVTARLILIPSPSWAGWGLMPYMSSFLATSSSWISERAGDMPLRRAKGRICGSTQGEAPQRAFILHSSYASTCVSCETWWSCGPNIPGWERTASSLNGGSPVLRHSPLALLQHTSNTHKTTVTCTASEPNTARTVRALSRTLLSLTVFFKLSSFK